MLDYVHAINFIIIIIIIIITSTARRPMYSVKLRLWKVSTFYFKIVATRQTYDADYHDHAAQIDAPRSHGEFSNPHHGVLMLLHNVQ